MTPEFDGAPAWTPDGTRIAFAGDRPSGLQILWKSVNDVTGEQPLFAGPNPRVPQAWSTDGRQLVFTEYHPTTGQDIWIGSLDNGAARAFIASPFDQSEAELSPDGRWLAYQSSESGRSEVFVRSFPGGGERTQLSTDGGAIPRWAPGGTALFFRRRTQLLAVDVETAGARLKAGRPRVLFDGDSFQL